MSPDSTSARASEGAFLLSLDSELKQDEGAITRAILVQSLFSRRICLTDSQLIDSPALERFFRQHWLELKSEAETAQELTRPPMLGSLSRRQADIAAVLDLMLTPNPRTGLPTYFSRLTEEQNRDLRNRLAHTTNADDRREVMFSVAGGPSRGHISRATDYFGQNPLAVIAAPQGSQHATLFSLVREQLAILDEPWNRRWMDSVDLAVRDALLREIDSNTAAQSRGRLHLAIYGGNPPQYYRGEIQPSSPGAQDTQRHSWRHFINTLYNFDLAQRYSSTPVLNSRWFALPRCLPSDEMADIAKLEAIGSVNITPVYFDYLTIPFVAAVRAEDAFWTSLERLEAASVCNDGLGYDLALKEHLRFVSSKFAEHLCSVGRRDLVSEKAVDLWERKLERGAAASSLILAGVGLWHGLPWQTVGSLVVGVVGSVRPFTVIARGLLGSVDVPSPKFKAFEVNLGKALKRSRL